MPTKGKYSAADVQGQYSQNDVAQAQSAPALAPAEKPGFFSSFADASGLTGLAHGINAVGNGLGNAILHPQQTAHAIYDATSDKNVASAMDSVGHGIAANTVGSVKAIGNAIAHPSTLATVQGRRAVANALPIIGPTLQTAEQQSDDGNNTGAMGSMAGLGTSFAAPELLGKGFQGAANLSSGLSAVTPDALKLAATRTLVDGTPGEVLTRALKPSVKFGGTPEKMLDSTLPAISAQGPISGVADFAANADAARNASAATHSATMAPYQPGAANPRSLFINGNQNIAAQVDSIPKFASFENPDLPSQIQAQAAPYNKWIPAAQADELRVGSNQQLHSYYNKSDGDQFAALASPETARVKAVGDDIRSQLYPAVESDQGLAPGSIADNQKSYGELSNVGDIANKRDAVFSRHDPVSLSQQVVMGHGGPLDRVGNFFVNKAIKGVTDSDALVRSAVDRFQNPSSPFIPQPGAVTDGLTAASNALQNVPLMSASRAVLPAMGAVANLPALPLPTMQDQTVVQGDPSRGVKPVRLPAFVQQ